MFSIIRERVEALSKEELVDLMEMLTNVIQPSIIPAVEEYLYAIEREKKQKASLSDSKGLAIEEQKASREMDELIHKIGQCLVSLSCERYIDDQYEIHMIYEGLAKMEKWLTQHYPSKEHAKRFAQLYDKWYNMFNACGLEDEAEALVEQLKDECV